MNWRAGYEWGPFILDIRSGIQIYEEAYLKILSSRRDLLDCLVHTASNCYDTSPSNVDSECSYRIQEVIDSGQHWQDVTLRRCLIRLKTWFQGDHLLEVRGHNSEGFRFNPSELPFHLVSCLARPRQYGWWNPDSIEDFSMSNFIVQVRAEEVLKFLEKESLESQLDIVYNATDMQLLNIMAALANGTHRTSLIIARTLQLIAIKNGMDLQGLLDFFLKTVQPISKDAITIACTSVSCCKNLNTEDLIDRLLYYDVSIRKGAIIAFKEIKLTNEDAKQVIANAVKEDPARKLRALINKQ